MSVLTKKHHTNTVAIILDERRPRRFIGPRSKLRLVRNLLTEMDFELDEDRVPWRKLAKDDIEKYGEAGLMLRGGRCKEGWTQVQLAKRLGIPQSHISAMENGSRPIGKSMAKKLAKVFNTDYRLFL